jgi:DNA-binding response OmpR family regulator
MTVSTQKPGDEEAMELDELAGAPEQASILVVEDDEDTAEFLRLLLINAGYQVAVAGDGPSALDRFKSETPDLVLMDLMLPGMDGYAVTRQIRSNAWASAPIIMLTAAGQPSSKLRGFDAGVDDFVVKPFVASELLARITVQLRRNQALRTLEDQSSFLQQALEVMSRRHQEATTSFEIERNMRNDLLRSVNTHLQSLCTIFDAELRRQPPGVGREALQRVIPRLRGAALIYQISEALTGETAEFDALLRTIASSLKNVYSPRKRIPVSVEAPPLAIPSAIASPLTMVASELITNAFKHAFPHSRFGAITIASRIMDGDLLLEVADDGVGFGETEPAATRGLMTIRTVIGELGGAFDLISSSTGTRATARVPLTGPKQAEAN